jgi:hypothetical protein
MTLIRTTYHGRPAWSWRDENGRRWYIYRSFSKWYYIREDHGVSSIGYATLAAAQAAAASAIGE